MTKGRLSELEQYVDRLMRSTSETSFLVVIVENDDDFIQMTGNREGVQLDFPLVTQRQQMREELIKIGAQADGLLIVENRGTNGARFFDIDIEGSAEEIAGVCRRFIKRLFDIDEEVLLTFNFDGLAD